MFTWSMSTGGSRAGVKRGLESFHNGWLALLSGFGAMQVVFGYESQGLCWSRQEHGGRVPLGREAEMSL